MEKLLVDTIEENFKRINENICNAALKAGRNSKEIALLAATKTVPPDIINYAISLGITDIGENRVQELNSKYDSLKLENCNLHMIGHLQTNKVKKIVGKVKCIQSVDSLKLMTEINRVSSINNITSDILVEVNIGREKNKSGVLPEYLEDLLVKSIEFKSVKIKGLMAIPPICEEKSKIRKYFSELNKIFIDIKRKKLDNICMDILSMGMSDDYVEAILEGSTMIRIGSSLFGKRI